jgi:gliding motility-associated-like protein
MNLVRIGMCLALVLTLQAGTRGQDFSNRGKDFWLCFPSHVPNERNATIFYAKMSVFITSDKNSSGTVSIPGIFNVGFSVTAGQVTEVDVPYNLAHITAAEAGSVIRKGIHVQTDPGKPPIVLYAHIYAGFRSAASLILPVAVLGKKYYSMNAPQVSITGSKSQFVVMAVDTATTVQIIPVRNGIKGNPFSITLPLPGDCYELQDNFDLTGSSIESISVGAESCKKIAVFSGSSAIHINGGACTPGDSYDPLYQQLYPVQAWGKQYGFIPFRNYSNGNPYRILASEDNTQLYINGFPVAMLDAGEFYPDQTSFGIVETNAVMLSADKPVSVAQYAQSSGCSGANPPAGTGYGDPDMVLLNPVEQQVDNITVFSSQKENIYSDSKFINVLIKQTAAASFTINGVAPAVTWQSLQPAAAGFAWAQIALPGNANAYTLTADSSFNAIAYGFGDFESYAYSAGTHVKDLYRTLTVENEFGNAQEPVACSNSAFGISITIPYQPQSISFRFYGLFADETIINPVPVETFVLNGKTVYRYRMSNRFTINAPGTYPLTVIAENNTNSGCNNGKDEMDYEIRIVDRPKADFIYTHSGCVNDPVQFTDASDAKGAAFTAWHWNFGDNSNSVQTSPGHTYASGDSYTVTHWAVNNIGCGTDTFTKKIPVTSIPVAGFDVNTTVCTGTSLSFINRSTVSGTGNIDTLLWDFGDRQVLKMVNGNAVSHSYGTQGQFTVGLQVQTNSGCKSAVFSRAIDVYPVPVASFRAPVFCLPSATGTFINESTISGGNVNQLNASWNFGDGNTSALLHPTHRYTSAGSFLVSLQVTSANGCVDDTAFSINLIPQAKLQWTADLENCLNDISHIAVKTASGQYAGLNTIYWTPDLSGTYADTLVNPQVNDVYLPIRFAAPGSHIARVFAETSTGCMTDTVATPIYINALPVAAFNVSAPFCDGRPIQFTDGSTAADGAITKWNWDFGNGMQSPVQSPQKTFTRGNHTVALSVVTDKGCQSSSIIFPLVISPLPVPSFTMPGACIADPFVPFANQSSIADASEDRLNYKWYFGDMNATPGNPDSSVLKDPQHSFTRAGEYFIKLIVTSKDGCVADTIKELSVNGAQVKAGFILNGGSAICNDKPLVLLDNSSIDAGSILRSEVYWNYDRDPLQKTVDDDPVAGETYSNDYTVAGAYETYRLRYIVYSGMNCLHSVDSVITINKAPVIQFNSLDEVCENITPFTVQAAAEISGLNGTGSYSGPGISPGGVFNPASAKAGMHSLYYTFQAENGCMASAVQSVRVLASPQANAGPDKVLRQGGSVKLEGSATGNALQYRWNPATYLDNASVATPVATPAAAITYTLVVTNAELCTATDQTTVKIISRIDVPNAFTPNYDGKHDAWKIPNLELFENCTVQVFSRWGERVFQSKGYSRPWDGIYKGQLLPPGTYTYIIDLKNGQQLLKGVVMILR